MNEIKIVIEGMKELTEAVNRLAAVQPGGNAKPVPAGVLPPSYMNPSMQQPGTGQVPQPVPVTAMQAPPAQPAAVPMQGPVPTGGPVQAYTIEQLQVAAAGLTGMGRMPQVMSILQSFGVQAMTELPKERYGEFAAALRGAGAQI